MNKIRLGLLDFTVLTRNSTIRLVQKDLQSDYDFEVIIIRLKCVLRNRLTANACVPLQYRNPCFGGFDQLLESILYILMVMKVF